MHRNELHNLVLTTSRYGASMEADEQLVSRVLVMTGARSTVRFVAAANPLSLQAAQGPPRHDGLAVPRSGQVRARGHVRLHETPGR